MVAVTTFYVDDSGTRHPDHDPRPAEHGHDWFALGGILIDDENIPAAKAAIREFRKRWPQMGDAPLHSCDIRGCHDAFTWLGLDRERRNGFLRDLEALLFGLPVVGLCCVIDRPGYNARYREKYGRQRWALCKTSFAVGLERATKYALLRERRLRVYVETCSKADDRAMREYYEMLRADGHWFNPATAGKYNPVTPQDYAKTLYDFKIKQKSSPLMQIADLYLWPMCMGGYAADNFPYKRLRDAGKLIDCVLDPQDVPSRGIKYSCFDGNSRP